MQKEKMLVPKLRFSEFDGEWENRSLKEILTIGSGKDYKHLGVGEIPVYGSGGLMTYVNDYLYDGNSIGIGRKGTIDKPVFLTGKFWTVDTLFYTHSFIKSDIKFIYNQFQRINWKKYNEAGGVPSLSKKTIERIQIKSPSLKEQTKIANFLTAIDTQIQTLEKKKSLLEQYKKGVMQKIFKQELRFKDENGAEFSEWRVLKLSDLFTPFKGKSLSKNKIDDQGVNKCILYGELYTTYPEVINHAISRTNSEEGFLSSKDDLLIPSSTTTTGIDLANVTCLKDEKVLLGGDIIVLRNKSEFKTENVFYAYYLSNYKKYELARLSQGSTIVHLYYSLFKNMNIHYPCYKEQTKIANFLSAIDKRIELVDTKIAHTKNYKKGLLQQMFV